MIRFACFLFGVFVCSGACAEEIDYEAPFLGVDVVDIAELKPPRTIKLKGGETVRLPVGRGVLVESVIDTGPAFGKLDPWDIIARVNAEEVADLASLKRLLSNSAKGEPVSLGIYRVMGVKRWSKPMAPAYGLHVVEVTPVTCSELIRSRMQSTHAPSKDAITFNHQNWPGDRGPTGIDIAYTRGPESSITLAINLRYSASEWLLVERWTVSVDGVDYPIAANEKTIRRKTIPGDGVRECSNASLAGDLKKLAIALEAANDVEVTCHGKRGFKAVSISEDNLMRLRESLDAARLDGWIP